MMQDEDRDRECSGVGVSGEVPVGLYWSRPVWDLARSAYLADLDTLPDSPNSFIGWLQEVLERHTALTPAARQEAAVEIPDGPGKSFSRTHVLDAVLLEAIDGAIVADRVEAGRAISRSRFLTEAVLVAVSRTRARLGNQLPPAPPRLPNRPRRRTPGK